MIFGYIIVTLILCLLVMTKQPAYKTLVYVLLYLMLVLQIIHFVLQPFIEVVQQGLSFVPFSELLLVAAISLFFSNIVAALLEQLELESFIPLTEIAIRFTLFVYCFHQLQPILLSLRKIFVTFS